MATPNTALYRMEAAGNETYTNLSKNNIQGPLAPGSGAKCPGPRSGFGCVCCVASGLITFFVTRFLVSPGVVNIRRFTSYSEMLIQHTLSLSVSSGSVPVLTDHLPLTGLHPSIPRDHIASPHHRVTQPPPSALGRGDMAAMRNGLELPGFM